MVKEFIVVRDKTGKIIQDGDVVVCLEPIEGYLAMNGLYTVKEVLNESGRISICSDLTGREGHFKSTRFKVVDLTNLPQW